MGMLRRRVRRVMGVVTTAGLVALVVPACSNGASTTVEASAPRAPSPVTDSSSSSSSTTSTTAVAVGDPQPSATTSTVGHPAAVGGRPQPTTTTTTRRRTVTTSPTATAAPSKPTTSTTQPGYGGTQGKWSCVWHYARAQGNAFDCQGSTPDGPGSWSCQQGQSEATPPWICTGATGAGQGSWTWTQDQGRYPFNWWRAMIPDALQKGLPGYNQIQCAPVTPTNVMTSPPTGDWNCGWYPTGQVPAASLYWKRLGDPNTTGLTYEGTGETGFGPAQWTCTRTPGLSADNTIQVSCEGTIGYPWLVTPAPIVWPDSNQG